MKYKIGDRVILKRGYCSDEPQEGIHVEITEYADTEREDFQYISDLMESNLSEDLIDALGHNCNGRYEDYCYRYFDDNDIEGYDCNIKGHYSKILQNLTNNQKN